MGFDYKLTCQYCGNTFLSKVKTSRYCSNACRCSDRYLRQREEARHKEEDTAKERIRQDLKSKDYLSITQAANLLGVSRPTIYKRIDSGEIEVIRLGARTVRIRREDLTAPEKIITPLNTPVPEIRKAKEGLVTIDEAAPLFGLSKGAVYYHLRKTDIQPVKIGPWSYYRLKDLENLLHRELDGDIQDWYTVQEISQKYNLTPKQVYDHVQYHHIPKRKAGSRIYISKFDWDAKHGRIDALSDHYYTARELQEKYGTSHQRVHYLAKTRDVPTIRQGSNVYFQKTAMDTIFNQFNR